MTNSVDKFDVSFTNGNDVLLEIKTLNDHKYSDFGSYNNLYGVDARKNRFS